MNHQKKVLLPASLYARLQMVCDWRYWLAFLALILIALAFASDDAVRLWVRAHATREAVFIARVVSQLSDWPILVSLLLASAGLAHGFKHTTKARFLLALALAGLVSGIGATVIRSVTGRARPSSHETPGFYGLWHESKWLVGCHEFNSFPSGHTATAAGVGGALLFLGFRAGLIGALLAGAVAWSRLTLNCHYFSDIVVSLILGIMGGWFTWRYFLPWLEVLRLAEYFNLYLTQRRARLGFSVKRATL